MRTWRWVLGSVALGAILYALYPRSPVPDGRKATEVTIWFNGPIEGRQIDVVDAFERLFPQYRAVLGSSAVRTGLEGEGNPQRLMCGIAGGVPPEVVEYDRFAICQWAARKAFLDLTPLIERDRLELEQATAELKRLRGAAGATASRSASAASQPSNDAVARLEARVAELQRYAVLPTDYFDPTWKECVYQGGVYGVPNYMDDRVLYYNEDMLLRAGFTEGGNRPKPPDTWEQILTKRVDVADAGIQVTHTAEAGIQGYRIDSNTADFVKAGVRPGDTLAHISDRGVVTRCVVSEILSPHMLKVGSPYANKHLALPARSKQRIKIFDQTGYALRLSRWDDDGRMRVVGFEPQHGNAWLYLWGWCNGGRFMSDDGRTCTLNDPRIVEALEWTTDVYDAMGGANDVTAFRKSFQRDNQDPFILNQVALFVNGDWFLRDPLVRYKRDMRFGTYPAPAPQRMVQAGKRNCTWVAGFAYCIPATCPPEKRAAAWALVKYLSSVEGGMVMNEHDAQRERGQGRVFMPRLMANRKLNQAQMERYVNVPEMPERVRAAFRTHIDMLAFGFFRPVSPEGQKLWNAQADAQDIAWAHAMSPQAALDRQSEAVQRALDKFDRPNDALPRVSWTPLVWLYAVLLAAAAGLVYVSHTRRNPARGFYRREWWAGWAFMTPWAVGFAVLSGGPMIFSAVMSLTEYDVISDARYVGAENYREMFTVDWGGPDAAGKETVPTGVRRALINTLYMAIGLPVGMVVGLGLALMLNAGIRGLPVYRTLFFLPAIMPVVAASILWLWVFNANNGLLNDLLHGFYVDRVVDWMHSTFDWFTLRAPISWLTNPQTSKPALIIMGLWGAGASMIIWLAGLKGIPTHLYEAAALDGAGAVRRFFRVTLPMLSPYILFNLIIGLIQTFQIFTQAYIMTPNGYPERSTYFYVYKLFDECFSYFRLGYGAAMAWVLFVIVLGLTLINMRLSRKWVFYAGE